MNSALAKPFVSQMFHLASYVHVSIWFHAKKNHLFWIKSIFTQLTGLCLTNLRAGTGLMKTTYTTAVVLQSCHSDCWVPTTVHNKAREGIPCGGLTSPEDGNKILKKNAFMEINTLARILWSSSGYEPGMTKQWQINFLGFIHWMGEGW